MAFYEPPFSAGGRPDRWFALRIFFDNQPHEGFDPPDRWIEHLPQTPGLGLALRLPDSPVDGPLEALLDYSLSHDGTVVSVRLPRALLGDDDGQFTVIAWNGLDAPLQTFAIPAICDGRPVNILGTAGHDVLYGNFEDVPPPAPGPIHQVVMGLAGNDILIGALNDHLCGGTGDDQLHGGGANDRLFGESGNDILYGHGGDDLLDGGPGYDLLFGGGSNDTLIGGPGLDVCDGMTGTADTADASCELTGGVP